MSEWKTTQKMVAKTIAWVNLRRILECGWRILVIGQKRKVMRVNEWFWHMHIYNQKTLPGFIMVIIFSSFYETPKMVYQERFLLSVQFSALAKIWAARLMMFKVKQRIHDHDDQKMTDDWLDHHFEDLCFALLWPLLESSSIT